MLRWLFHLAFCDERTQVSRHAENGVVRCVCTCGWASVGWTADLAPPRTRYAGDAERHKIERKVGHG